mmetsp:Transcript_21811/g.72119  ORF Transcript_21811/g.72119 Transcript_21811/m.72119 type:complete len:85 (+) Transcript_21811:726-980(+)
MLGSNPMLMALADLSFRIANSWAGAGLASKLLQGKGCRRIRVRDCVTRKDRRRTWCDRRYPLCNHLLKASFCIPTERTESTRAG